MTYDDHKIIGMYKDGLSINAIAREIHTYPTTVRRVLVKNKIELRHDNVKKGEICVQDGEKLIEWAKSQGRLVTKTELAQVLGKKKLSPSYFIKYPELSHYVQTHSQKDNSEFINKLYTWLKENNIPYKPNDRTKLQVAVDALLLGEYSNIALHVAEKPTCVSIKTYTDSLSLKQERARANGVYLILLDKTDIAYLDNLKRMLNTLKKR